jgi:hypothetical protein
MLLMYLFCSVVSWGKKIDNYKNTNIFPFLRLFTFSYPEIDQFIVQRGVRNNDDVLLRKIALRKFLTGKTDLRTSVLLQILLTPIA